MEARMGMSSPGGGGGGGGVGGWTQYVCSWARVASYSRHAPLQCMATAAEHNVL